METGQPAKAISPFEQSLKLKPEDLATLWNLVVCSNGAKEEEKRRYWSEVTIPICERYLKLFPDDETWRVHHALLLRHAGRDAEAREAARRLENLRDGSALYNAACLQRMLEDDEAGLKTFRQAIEAGFRSIHHITEFLNDEDEGIAKLKGTPEWVEVKEIVEKIEAEATAKAHT
jgi:tetratricopeptide (TPR) repeat protein